MKSSKYNFIAAENRIESHSVRNSHQSR